MSQESKEEPLQTERFIKTDKVTGLQIPVTRHRRGVLVSDTGHYSLHNLPALASISPREKLEQLRDHLRDRLEHLGLPSDRTPKPPSIKQDWTKRIEDLVEPLSAGDRAGKLLWHLNRLLNHPFTDNDLWLVNEFAEFYFNYQVGGMINQLATVGSKAVDARKAGPVARQRRSAEALAIVRRHAEAFWMSKPLYADHASHTAGEIQQVANEDLRRHSLRPLGRKTMADYVGVICRGKKTATG